MSCEPKPKKPSIPYSTLTPCDRLAVCDDALMALASGTKRTVIRHGDFWCEYGQGNVAFLERERAQLRIQCHGRSAITMGRSANWPCETKGRFR